MIIYWLILSILLLIIIYKLTGDYANPAFISGFIWTGIYIILLNLGEFLSDELRYSSFFFAFLSFTIGFFLPMKVIDTSQINEVQPIKINAFWEPNWERLLILIEYIVSVIYVVLCYGNLRSYGRSVWQTFLHTMSESAVLGSWWSSAFRDAITMIFIVAVAFCLLNPSRHNKRVLLASVPPLIIIFLFGNRGLWFMVFTAMAFTYVYIRRPSGKRIAVIGILGVVAFLIIFLISSFDKFSKAWIYENNSEKITRYIRTYFASPPVAFLTWLDSGYPMQNGKYTFRFICALLHVLFPNIEVVNVVQPFVNVVGYPSNVYTALHWYSLDFGLWWAFIVEFVLGMVYGLLYKKVRMNEYPSIFAIIMLSLLIYPIVGQFFDEMFLTNFSSWLQRMIVIFAVLHSPLTVIEYDAE